MNLGIVLIIIIIILIGLFILFMIVDQCHQYCIDNWSNDFAVPGGSPEKNGIIFVSVASYRDPECVKTVDNLLSTADNPELLYIYVYEQNGPNDISVIPRKNVKVHTVSYKEARGPGWARYIIQSGYTNQEYFLQIDSHTRFTPHWDTVLKNMLESLPPKSVLTQYPPDYDIPTSTYDTSILRSGLYIEGFKEKDKFSRIQSEYYYGDIPDRPFVSEAWAACFSFSRGDIVKDAPYDPYLPYLFFGEELDITLRLYTRGWNFYSPHVSLVFTNFSRIGRKTIWNDHDSFVRNRLEMLSRNRLYRKFGSKFSKFIIQGTQGGNGLFEPNIVRDIEYYSLGDVRSISDYEEFAGVDFANQTVTGHNRKRIMSLPDGRQSKLQLFQYQGI